MVKIGVEDVEAWHGHVEAMAESGAVPGMRFEPPEKVDTWIVLHVVDPSGVLLVLVQ